MKNLLTLIAFSVFCSCETEEIPQQIAAKEIEQPTEITPPSVILEADTVPDWLIGQYSSRFYPDAPISTITAQTFEIQLQVFNAPYFHLIADEMDLTINESYVEVGHLGETMLQFWRNNDPQNTDIKIVYFNQGIIYQYGWFRKL